MNERRKVLKRIFDALCREQGLDNTQASTAVKLTWTDMKNLDRAFAAKRLIRLAVNADTNTKREENAGCDKCGIHDREPGKMVCAECAGS